MEIAEILGTTSVIVASIFGSTGLWTYLTNLRKSDGALEELIKGLARYQIISEISKHQINGWLTRQEYEDIHKHLYDPYKELGGNGLVSKYIRMLDELPLSNDGDTLRNMKPPVESDPQPKYITDASGNHYELKKKF